MTFLHLIIDCEKLVIVSVVDHLLVGSWRMWRMVLTCQYPAMSRQALRKMWKTTMWWWSLDCLSSSSLNTVRTVWYNSWWGKIKIFAQQFMRVETVMIWYVDHILGYMHAESFMHKASLVAILLWSKLIWADTQWQTATPHSSCRRTLWKASA